MSIVEVVLMVNTDCLIDSLNKYETFSRADLQTIMEINGYKATQSSTSHMIDRLISSGDILKTGRNQYSATSHKSYYTYPHSDSVIDIVEEITKAHPYLDFRVFELVQLNEFVNHQIAHNIIFVSVEADLGDYVFNTLWEEHHGSILIKPTIDELYRYMNDEMIIINKLPSESPKGKTVFWDTRIEKMLVDIAVDKILKKVVYSAEYPVIYKDAVSKYIIDKNVMTRYARRRGALDKFRQFLRDQAGLSEENFEI